MHRSSGYILILHIARYETDLMLKQIQDRWVHTEFTSMETNRQNLATTSGHDVTSRVECVLLDLFSYMHVHVFHEMNTRTHFHFSTRLLHHSIQLHYTSLSCTFSCAYKHGKNRRTYANFLYLFIPNYAPIVHHIYTNTTETMLTIANSVKQKRIAKRKYSFL